MEYEPCKTTFVPHKSELLYEYRERLNKKGYDLVDLDKLPKNPWGDVTRVVFQPKNPSKNRDYYLVVKINEEKLKKKLTYGDQFLSIPDVL